MIFFSNCPFTALCAYGKEGGVVLCLFVNTRHSSVRSHLVFLKCCLFTWTGVRCQDVMPDWLQSNSCAGLVQSTGATVSMCSQLSILHHVYTASPLPELELSRY